MQQYVTFETKAGTKTGLLFQKNSKTTIVNPVSFLLSMITRYHIPIHDHLTFIKLHNKKAKVRIYPNNIIPIN